MGSIKIAPSILSADMANLKGDLDKIAGADYVHFDVMDGHFTGNLTFGVDILKAVKRSTAADPKMILCKRKGVVSPYYCCRKFSYDPLMRIPRRQVLPELDPRDFTLDD